MLLNLIRFRKAQFEALFKKIEPVLKNLTTRDTPRIRGIKTNKEKVSLKSHLFITLLWLRHYPTDLMMKAIFCLDQRKITRILNRTLTAACESLEYLIAWPSDSEFETLKEQWNLQLPQHLKDLVCVVDGTEIRIPRPIGTSEERQCYSVKKNNIVLLQSRPNLFCSNYLYSFKIKCRTKWRMFVELLKSFVLSHKFLQKCRGRQKR
jgi:hypothetical protein